MRDVEKGKDEFIRCLAEIPGRYLNAKGGAPRTRRADMNALQRVNKKGPRTFIA